jgi:membrane-associated phospholipid phosphatase
MRLNYDSLDQIDKFVDEKFDLIRPNKFFDITFYLASLLGDFGFIWFIIALANLKRKKLQFGGFLYYVGLPLIVCPPVNYGIKRLFFRPRANNAYFKYMRHPRSSSMPSGHTIAAFYSASLNGSPSYYLLAFMIGASRIYSKEHKLSDVLAGAITGIVLGSITKIISGRLRVLIMT